MILILSSLDSIPNSRQRKKKMHIFVLHEFVNIGFGNATRFALLFPFDQVISYIKEMKRQGMGRSVYLSFLYENDSLKQPSAPVIAAGFVHLVCFKIFL